MTTEKPKKQLGEILKEKGIITEDHIKYALQVQKITKDRLGEIFEKLGFVTENDTVKTLAEQTRISYVDVDEVLAEDTVLKLFNKNLCLNNIFLPIRKVDGAIEVAAYNVQDLKLGQLISRQTGLNQYFIFQNAQRLSMRLTSCTIFWKILLKN